MPCLVQQLFRLKIGKALDINIVDDVLFPLLLKEKHSSRELLQDIKLTRDILICHAPVERDPEGARSRTWPHRRETWYPSIPIFTKIPSRWFPLHGEGKLTSKVLRKNVRGDDWGVVDILNELRDINFPEMGYRYIHLEEDTGTRGICMLSEQGRKVRSSWQLDLINRLDDVIVSGKRLSWDGECPRGGGRSFATGGGKSLITRSAPVS